MGLGISSDSIILEGLDELTDRLNQILKEFPEKRKELHERLAVMIKETVDSSITAAGFRDGGEMLKRMQERYVGSGGGYAAVRPTNKTTGDNSPGAITRYNEDGHKIRKSEHGKGYRPRIKTPYVNGRHFYANAESEVESKAIKLAEDFVKEIAGRLE